MVGFSYGHLNCGKTTSSSSVLVSTTTVFILFSCQFKLLKNFMVVWHASSGWTRPTSGRVIRAFIFLFLFYIYPLFNLFFYFWGDCCLSWHSRRYWSVCICLCCAATPGDPPLLSLTLFNQDPLSLSTRPPSQPASGWMKEKIKRSKCQRGAECILPTVSRDRSPRTTCDPGTKLMTAGGHIKKCSSQN